MSFIVYHYLIVFSLVQKKLYIIKEMKETV